MQDRHHLESTGLGKAHSIRECAVFGRPGALPVKPKVRWDQARGCWDPLDPPRGFPSPQLWWALTVTYIGLQDTNSGTGGRMERYCKKSSPAGAAAGATSAGAPSATFCAASACGPTSSAGSCATLQSSLAQAGNSANRLTASDAGKVVSF